MKWYIWGQERNTFYLVCLDSRIDLWVSGHNDCLGKSNTVYHLLSIWFIDSVDWSQFSQLESVILTSMVWYWSILPRGVGWETKRGCISFGWQLSWRPRWTESVSQSLVVLEVVYMAHTVLWDFVFPGLSSRVAIRDNSLFLWLYPSILSYYDLIAVLVWFLCTYWLLLCRPLCWSERREMTQLQLSLLSYQRGGRCHKPPSLLFREPSKAV